MIIPLNTVIRWSSPCEDDLQDDDDLDKVTIIPMTIISPSRWSSLHRGHREQIALDAVQLSTQSAATSHLSYSTPPPLL